MNRETAERQLTGRADEHTTLRTVTSLEPPATRELPYGHRHCGGAADRGVLTSGVVVVPSFLRRSAGLHLARLLNRNIDDVHRRNRHATTSHDTSREEYARNTRGIREEYARNTRGIREEYARNTRGIREEYARNT